MAFCAVQWILRILFGHNKWIWTLANLFCTASFLFQLFHLLPSYLDPTMTNTEVTNEQLKDMDFPLDIKICMSPLLNSSVLQQLGYDQVSFYHMGASSNGSLIGWGGHNNASGAVTTAKEVLKAARMNISADILKSVFIRMHGSTGSENVTDWITLERINWLEECHVLNLTRIGKKKLDGMEQLLIFVNPSFKLVLSNSDVTLELKVGGKTLAARRELMEHQFYHSGPDMKLAKLSHYMMRIKKNVFVEEDPSKSCRIYPNSDFASYKECDYKYMRDKVDKYFPGLNLIPPWLTEDLENVTSRPVQIPKGRSAIELQRLSYGMETSDCPLPCTTISTDAKLANKMNDGLGFALEFKQTVEVSGVDIKVHKTRTS